MQAMACPQNSARRALATTGEHSAALGRSTRSPTSTLDPVETALNATNGAGSTLRSDQTLRTAHTRARSAKVTLGAQLGHATCRVASRRVTGCGGSSARGAAGAAGLTFCSSLRLSNGALACMPRSRRSRQHAHWTRSPRAAEARRAPSEAATSRSSRQRMAPSLAISASPGLAHQPSSTI